MAGIPVELIVSFFTLTLMEIILGIDNVIFISILCSRLPKHQQERARVIGLSLALVIRIILLFGLSLLIGLTEPLFEVFNHPFSGRDLIFLGGGIFLIYKSTSEISAKLEGSEEDADKPKHLTMNTAILQIIALDIVFSFDSILTAIGLVENVYVIIIAVVISMAIMLFAARAISNFFERHPGMKMLALAFLLMIGVLLFVEGFHIHVPKGYIYFAMFFSVLVELLNIRSRAAKETKPVQLKKKLKEQ